MICTVLVLVSAQLGVFTFLDVAPSRSGAHKFLVCFVFQLANPLISACPYCVAQASSGAAEVSLDAFYLLITRKPFDSPLDASPLLQSSSTDYATLLDLAYDLGDRVILASTFSIFPRAQLSR